MSSASPPSGTILIVMTKAAASKRRQKSNEDSAIRERILEAAFEAFMQSGYAAASTWPSVSRLRGTGSSAGTVRRRVERSATQAISICCLLPTSA